MSNNHYKVFFTISFIYAMGKKKKVSKSFKSDLDINNILLKCSLNDINVHEKWNEFVMKSSINELNPPLEFNNTFISKKKVITHRIVNLMNLTEIHVT